MATVLETLNAVVRPVVLFTLTSAVVYLALSGQVRAVDALVAQFVAVSSFAFGVHAGQSLPQQIGKGSP